MNPKIAVLAAGSLFMIGSVCAQQPQKEETAKGIPPTPHQEGVTAEVEAQRFAEIDENRDGFISRQEAPDGSALVDEWSEYDRNRDDKLNAEEFAAFETTQAGPAGRTEAEVPSSPHQREAVREDVIDQQSGDGKPETEEPDSAPH